MSKPEHNYVLSGAAPAAELERLRRIDELMGPTTERRIERLGLARG